MRSQPPGRILTARLELLPVVAEDADELAEVFLDQRMYAFTGGRPGTLEGLRATFARLEADQTAQRNWTVRRRADRQAVGMLQAVLAEDGRSAQIAWAVGVRWQGQGIASEAARAVVAWLERRGVATITAHIHPDHHASAAVAARAGLRPTGRFREHDGIREQRWSRPPPRAAGTATPTPADP